MRIRRQIPLFQLALVLAICCGLIGGWKTPDRPSYGVVVLPLIKMHSYSSACRLGGDFTVNLQIEQRNEVLINATGPMSWHEARGRLKAILSTRSPQVIYVNSYAMVNVGDYESVIAELQADSPNLKTVLLTSRSEKILAADLCHYGYKDDPDFS